MNQPDLRPTLAAPDDDPFLWLEEIEGARALAFAAEQSGHTLARFGGPAFERDRDALAAILNRKDRIPFVAKRGAHVYNFWQDDKNPRGLWRRTSLAAYRAGGSDWQVLLDIDALATTENEDWVWAGSISLPGSHDRAMLRLSRGGSDAAVFREPPKTGVDGVPGDAQGPGQGQDRGVRVVVKGQDDLGVERIDRCHIEHNDTKKLIQ